MANKSNTNKYLLVERSSVRYKVDGHLKQSKGDANFKRIKMDIEDLYLGKVPELDPEDAIIIVGKHLCGGATDMGLRCAVNTLMFENGESVPKLEPDKCSSNFLEMDKDCKDIHSTSPTRIVVASPPIDVSAKPSASTVQECTQNLSSKPKQSSSKDCLKRMEGTDSRQNINEPPPKAAKIDESPDSVKGCGRLPEGVMIALCCHHRCTWDTYVGKSFMTQLGVSPDEFELLTRLSSWATCARTRVKSDSYSKKQSLGNMSPRSSESESVSPSSKPVESSLNHCAEDLMVIEGNSSQTLREQLSIPERERIGRFCKRLIDTGRLKFLSSKGMNASLREYIDDSTTPENVVLIAHS